MKILLFITFLIFSTHSFGFELPSFQKKKVNIHHIRMIRNAYVDFAKEIEKNNKYEESSFVKIQKLFLSVAYADDAKCFFGGWPSQMNGEVCKSPLTHGNTLFASNVDCKISKNSQPKSCNKIIDFTYNSCGSRGEFRCNPILFGANQKGQGKCINTNGTYKKLTQKCVDQTKGSKELRDSEQFLKANPDLLDEYRKSIESFCSQTYRVGEDYDHNYTCDALRQRLGGIVEDVVADEKEVVEAQEIATVKANKALGILDRCQKDYKSSKDGMFSEFFASRRESLDQMVDYGKCSSEEIDLSVSSSELKTLISEFDNVSDRILPKEILNDSVNAGVELTLKNLLFTMDQFGEQLNLKSVLSKFPTLKGAPYKENVEQAIEDFKRAKDSGALNKTKIDKDKIVSNLNDFSDKINSLCQNINTEYTKRTKSRDPEYQIEDGMFVNTDSEQKYYDESQVKMTEMYQDFLDSDQLNLSRLMATNHFKSDIFPFSNGLSEKCAEGDIDNIAFTPVGREDIEDAMEDYKELMLDELGDYNKMARVRNEGDINDSIHDLIKYRPYLLGNFLKKSNSNPNLQSVYATYLCKESLNVYSNDELWRIGEVTAGGAGLVVSGALIATGIGSPLGVGLAAASGSLIAAEGAMAVNNYMDASKESDASSGSFATESISLEQHTKNNDLANNKKTEALISGGIALVQPVAFLAKSAKATNTGVAIFRNTSSTTSSASKGSKVAETPLRLTNQSTKARRGSRAVVESVDETSPATKAVTPYKSSVVDDVKPKQKTSSFKAEQPKKKTASNGSSSRRSQRQRAKERAKAKQAESSKAEPSSSAKSQTSEKPPEQPKKTAKESPRVKARRQNRERAQAKNIPPKEVIYKTKSEVSDFILKNHSMVKKLPTDAVKGYTYKSIAGVKNVLKQITGKDYAEFSARDMRKEIKRLSTIFHPDKIQGKNDFFINTVNDEMGLLNALKAAL